MKRASILILSCALVQFTFGQSSVMVEAGQNQTQFRYLDDTETKDTSYNPSYSGSWAIGYSYALDMGVYFNTKVGMRSAGASYVYDEFQYRWDLRYAEYRLGVGYRYPVGKVTARFETEGYAAYLVSADQRLHNLDRDMTVAGTFERWDYGLFVSPGVEYGLTEKLGVYLDARYMFGLANIETDPDQVTNNRLLGLNLGVTVKL